MCVEPVQQKLLCDPEWGRISGAINNRFGAVDNFVCFTIELKAQTVVFSIIQDKMMI